MWRVRMKTAIKKTVALYDNTIHVAFSNIARNRYVVLEDGHSPVGVTTVLQTLDKPGLMTWPMYEAIDWLKAHPEDWEGAAKAFTKKSDKGKSTGTDVHSVIEQFLNDVRVIAPEIAKPVDSFIEWFNATQPKVLTTEQIIYSKEFDYCDTYDALLEIDGKVTLCDIKTNNASRYAPLGIYPEMFL